MLVTPSGSPPKLGVYLPGVQIVRDTIQVYDVGRALQGCADKWAGMTLFAIMVHNSSAAPLELGPNAVTIIDGRGTTLTPLSADHVIERAYGSNNPFEEDGIRQVQTYIMKNGVVGPGEYKEGHLYIGQDALAEPVTVRVTLSGRVYTMRFGQPRNTR